MGDKRNFAALEWVIGEISDTLKDARQALEAYVEDPKDSTRMRFCLTHIHQVHGSLQMVEFHGASLLAEEMEHTAQAIINNDVASAPEAQEVLMRSMLQLPIYLDHVKIHKEDHPGVVLPLLNDLRAVRKQSFLSETNLFSPDMSAAERKSVKPHPVTQDAAKLTQVLKKLREMYQFSAASVLRGIKIDENLTYIDKVMGRLELLTRGTTCHATWDISAALVDALRRDDLELSVAVRGLLRFLARELRILGEKAPQSLARKPPVNLLKNLLYYVGKADAGSERVARIRAEYKLDTAEFDSGYGGVRSDGDGLNAPDPEAIRSVVVALQEELNTVKHILDICLTGQGNPEGLAEVLPVVKRVGDTLAVLGIGDLRKQIVEQADVLEKMSQQNSLDEDELMQVATRVIDVEHKLDAISKVVGKSRDINDINEREIEIDQAKATVINECRHGLEKAKDAIVEYISSKWDVAQLENIGGLLHDIRGGLDMIPLARPAAIMDACNRYIQEALLSGETQPSWKALDALADAMASVEFYLERLSVDLDGDADQFLDIAEESVASLGFAVAARPVVPSQVIETETPVAEDSFAADTQADAVQDQSGQEASAQEERAQQEQPAESFDQGAEAAYEAQEPEDNTLDSAFANLPQVEIDEPQESVENEASDVSAVSDESTADYSEQPSSENGFGQQDTASYEAPQTEPSFAEPADASAEEQQPAQDPADAPISLDMISVDDEPVAEEESDIDEEIIEIFIEEAGEVLETLEEYFPKWRADPTDNDSLVIVRRAFHTLKGSGRMVEAYDVGELAWSVENMLNRIIDKTVPYTAAHGNFIQLVLELTPTLVEAFKNRTANPQKALTETYMGYGAALAEGSIPDEVKELAGSDAATDSAAQEEHAQQETEAPPAYHVEEDDDDDEDDRVLKEIFSSEARSHLATIQQFVDEMEAAAPIYTPPTDSLQRALHTLKGSAKMAQVTLIAEMAEPLENFAKELITYQVPITDDILQLIKDAGSYTAGAIEAVENGREIEVSKLPQFLARAFELREMAVGHLIRLKEMEKQGVNKVDPRLLSIFMAEEMTLLLEADQLLAQWQNNPGELERIDDVIRELTTLEQGAQQANLPDMASLSQRLSTVHGHIKQNNLQLDEGFFETLLAGHNALLDMVDAVAAGQNMVPPQEYVVAAIESLIHSAEANAATKAEAPQFDAEQADEFGSEEIIIEDFSELNEQEGETEAEQQSELQGEQAEQLNPQDFSEPTGEEAFSFGEATADASNESFDLGEQAGETAEFDNAQEEVPTAADQSDTLAFASDAEEVNEISAGDDDYLDLVVEPLLIDEEDSNDLEINFDEESSEEISLEDESTFEDNAFDNVTESLTEQTEETFGSHDNAFDTPTADETFATQELTDEHQSAGELGEHIDVVDVEGLGEPASEAEQTDTVDFELPHGDEAEFNSDVAAEAGDQPEAEESSDVSDSDFSDSVLSDSELNESDFDELPEPPLEPQEPVAPVAAEPTQPSHPVAEGMATIDGLLDSIDIQDPDYDEDIVEVFLEEADELCEELDEAIHTWESDWSNAEPSEIIKRALHTLKGGARLSGMNNLGELTHEYESYIIGTDFDSTDEAFFAQLHSYQDKVLRGVRALHQFMRGDAAQVVASEEPTLGDVELVEEDEAGIAMVKQAQTSEAPSTNDGEPGSSNVVPFAPKTKDESGFIPTRPKEEDSGFVMPHASGGAQAAPQVAMKRSGPQEVVKVPADLLEELVNLAGETSISRGRLEQQVNDFGGALEEIDGTIHRLQEQLRRLDIETEAQIIFRQEQIAESDRNFDPLEMDRYSQLQQLSRSLIESASDLADLRSTLTDKVRDTETLLLQQSRINSTLQEGLMRSRMVPFSRLVPRLRRIVRQVSSELGKSVTFELDNIEGELDRSVLERMVAPLEHMLRNAVDHGIEMPDVRANAGKSETGRIVLTLGREGGDVTLRLADDGRGIDLKRVREKAIERGLMVDDATLSDRDIMQFILHAGFSTAESVTQISGRGVGMDVVHAEIKQLGGSVSINSEWGKGTEFLVRLPFTVSVNRALMVALGSDYYAVPLNNIEGIVRVSPFELEHYYQNPEARFEYAGENYQVRYLGSMLIDGMRAKLEGQSLPLPVLLVRSAEHTMALQVDTLLGSREIVVKSLGQQFSTVQGLSGATVMGDGSVVVILDPHALVRKEMALATAAIAMTGHEPVQEKEREVQTVMVVDDSVTVRKVTTRFLEREGFNVITAKDGVDALRVLQDEIPDVMLLDIEMPRMDGFEVAKNIRSSQRWRDIPIIMITSRTGDKHREHALSLGVNKYLGKPYQEDVLLESIVELIGGDDNQ